MVMSVLLVPNLDDDLANDYDYDALDLNSAENSSNRRTVVTWSGVAQFVDAVVNDVDDE